MMSIVTAVFSAFLDNVTTVLLTVPVTLLITEELRVKPYPYLFAQIFASNIGGTATLIGDPPNIMIGSATGLTFNDFALALTPVIVVIMVATMVPLYYIWGRHLRAADEDRQRVMSFNEREAITDPRLLKQSLTVIALVIAGLHAAAPDRHRAGDASPSSAPPCCCCSTTSARSRRSSRRTCTRRCPRPSGSR